MKAGLTQVLIGLGKSETYRLYKQCFLFLEVLQGEFHYSGGGVVGTPLLERKTLGAGMATINGKKQIFLAKNVLSPTRWGILLKIL